MEYDTKNHNSTDLKEPTQADIQNLESAEKNMTKHQKIRMVLSVFVLVAIACVIAFFIISEASAPEGANEELSPDMQNREYSLFLNAATDDQFINYYQVGINMPLDTGIVDFDAGFSPGPRQCPLKQETYTLNVTYNANVATLSFDNYKYLENRENLTTDDPECKELPAPLATVDLDKTWLATDLDKAFKIEGTDSDPFSLILADNNHELTLLDGEAVLSRIPFYPDKVAVLATYPCENDTLNQLTEYARAQRLETVDSVYPGLNEVYRRPTKELHIAYTDKARELMQATNKQYEDTGGNILTPPCTPRITQPILKSLDTPLSP